LEIKKRIFCENLRRIGGLEIEVSEIAASSPLRYRTRAKFKAQSDGRIGFIRKGTNSVLPVSNCYLVKDSISEFLREWNCRSDLPFLYQLNVLSNNHKLYVHLSHSPKEKFLTFFESFKGSVIFSWKGEEENSVSQLEISNYRYLISPAVFFQVNHFLWERMLSIVDEFIDNSEGAVDLYSGVGFFIPVLKKYTDNITAIESSGYSIKLAKRAFPGMNILKGSAEKFTFPRADLIIVDPPRSGLSGKVVKKIMESRYPRLIYISCNSASFSRDCRILIEEGKYRVKDLKLLDLFPQTPHLESIALFELHT
jgi:23S rRNA (uracil1939-C5)-methyltransferase